MEGRIDTDVLSLRRNLLYHLVALDKDFGGTNDIDCLATMIYEAVVAYRVALAYGVGNSTGTSNL